MNPVLQAIGVHIPPGRVSNYARLDEFGITKEFLLNKIGVLARAIMGSDESTSDLCVKAFENLKSQLDLDETKVELVCVVTQNPDLRIPHASAIVHQKLGLSKPCMTFDISQGCAGYTHGLAIVDSLMRRLKLNHALLFTCDPYSRIIDESDRNASLLFGDAATVSYLSTSGSGYQIAGTTFGTLPNSYHYLVCEEKFEMDGGEMSRTAATEVPLNINALLESQGLKITDVDLLVLHQASKAVIELLRESIGVDPIQAPFDIADFGNTISSSIPIALQRHIGGRRHSNIVLSGFGVGFTMASNLLKLQRGT